MNDLETKDELAHPKEKRRKISSFIKVLLAINVLALAIIFYQQFLIKKMTVKRDNYQSRVGDTLPKIDLIRIGKNAGNSVEPIDFSQGMFVLLFFKSNCLCSNNHTSWKNLASYWGTRIKVLGILPTEREAAEKMLESRQFTFEIFIPKEWVTFRQQMGIVSSEEQTILVFQNKVIAIKLGTLRAEDLADIFASIKTRLKTI